MATRMLLNRVGMSFYRYIRKIASIVLVLILTVFMSCLVWSAPAQADDIFGCFQGTGNPPLCPSATDPEKPPLFGSSLGKSCVEGKNNDWDTSDKPDAESDVTVLSIHGGEIEPHTSQISKKLNEIYGWNRYDFSGHIRSNSSCEALYKSQNAECDISPNFCVLHITSVNFNHEKALNIVEKHPKAVAIHGCSQPSCSADTICVGGQAKSQIDAFINYVEEYKRVVPNVKLATFNVWKLKNTPSDESPCNFKRLLGASDRNIVNKAKKVDGSDTKGGLQLEINRRIRNSVANNPEDLLSKVIYGGIGHAMGERPLPLVVFNNSESYTENGRTFTRYNLSVENRSEYPSELFKSAPNLPPCGLETNSSRTWVNVYNAKTKQYIDRFCTPSPRLLDSIRIDVEQGQTSPEVVYISLEDRQTNKTYRSNEISIRTP